MGLFPRFDEEEPGRSSDVPRRTGFSRFWKILRRDVFDDFKAGFLALLGCVPFIAGMFLAVTAYAMALAPVCGLIGGAIAGPQLCALADTLLRSLRDDTGGVWWRTYRRAWGRSAKASLLPGAVGGALLATQLFMLLHADALQVNLPMSAALVLGILFLLGLSLYLWSQLALMELGFGQLIKNSALLFIGQLPRTAAALGVLAAYILVSLRFFAAALSLLPLTNFWLPVLPALFLIYPGLEQAFRLDEKFRSDQKPPEDIL